MMENRQIIFAKPNLAQLIEKNVSDDLDCNGVLVKTEYTAISNGTERANLTGELNINGSKKLEKVVFPRTLGYSGVGIVEKVGERVTRVKVGDRVIIYFGTHSQYNVTDEENVYRIDYESVASEEASMIVIAGFSLAGVRKTRLELGESILITGLGILGMFAVEIAKAAGAVPVIASDLYENRLKLAKKIGAEYVLNSASKNYKNHVMEITKKKGVDVAIEVTGVSSGLIHTLDCMAMFGRVSLLGCTRNPDQLIDLYHKVHYPGVSLIGAHNFARPKYESSPGRWTKDDDFETILKLLDKKRLDFTSLISEIHSPEEAEDVYNRLAYDGKNFPIGVLFDWNR